MTGSIGITSGPPDSQLPPVPEDLEATLSAAGSVEGPARRAVLANAARSHPERPEPWAALGESTTDDVEAYAYFRVGYHRGLDGLRKSGWRGSGYVRFSAPSNRGFLRCLDGLGSRAGAIGETEEQERCALFLHQLDPAWPGSARSGA